MATPSIAQMKNRATSGHRKALAAIADGRPVLDSTARPSEYRGMRTVLDTLHRWDCVTADGLTDRGAQLLEALQ